MGSRKTKIERRMKTEIYFSPNSNYKKELTFFSYLIHSNKNLIHRHEKYPLPEKLLQCFLNRDEILFALQKDVLLPAKAKGECMKVLKNLPKQIAVINSLTKISVDFVIRKDKQTFYTEFHEKQHRRLSKKTEYSIYNTSFDEIKVPRFVQRFLKDIWRFKYLPNYQIIWWDWFEANPTAKIDLFSRGKKEFHLPGKFSFTNFLKNTK